MQPISKILITGASGFIGSFLVERALAEGMDVWAAVRPSSSRRYLADPRIHFIEIDFGSEKKMMQALTAHVAAHGAWHYVIHAAGATKCRREADFFKINTEGTALFAQSLLAAGALTGRFVFISSLSVCGPLCEDSGRPICAADVPQPNTAYGRSKLEAEQQLAQIDGLDYIVLRPTGVYGPREKDYAMMADSIRRHVDFSVGFKPQVLTFIYVKDLVAAAFLALTRGTSGKSYFLTDGKEYSSRDFSLLIQKRLGIRFVVHVTAPLCVLWLVSRAAEWIAARRGTLSTLNSDKYRIMKQRNWRCDITPAVEELGYKPAYDLRRGVEETFSPKA